MELGLTKIRDAGAALSVRPVTPSKGFALIETLITVVILGVGLLGLASMQFNGLRTNHNAYLMTQASLLVSDIADRMRSNREAAATGAYAFDGETLPKDPGYDCVSSFPSGSTECAASELAKADVYQWLKQVDSRVTAEDEKEGADEFSLLPVGRGMIACNGDCANGVYRIELRWDEDRDGKSNSKENDGWIGVDLLP